MVTGPHAEKAEATARGPTRRGAEHLGTESHGADQVARDIRRDHRQADVVSGKITRDEAGRVSRAMRPFCRRRHDCFYMA